MKSKRWLIGWSLITILGLGIIGASVVRIDPYMHYHRPLTQEYFYSLSNQRSQNNGIIRHFDYDALITGTSMTENFKSSELDALYGYNSIKIPFAGASFKEINDNLSIAVKVNPNLKYVFWCLDEVKFFEDKDFMREDMGVFPTYLYDNNPFNDVDYLWNKTIMCEKIYPMVSAKKEEDFTPGIRSFDEYSNWQEEYDNGFNTVCPEGISGIDAMPDEVHLTEAERKGIEDSINQNIVSFAKENPNITFYCFFPPYSAVWWHDLIADGTIYRQLEAEKCVIELLNECDNIKLFSFNNRHDITTDLNNYSDLLHYSEWINSLILQWMMDDTYRLTLDNYAEYQEEEFKFYTSFDYESLNEQEDYDNDYFAGALLRETIDGVKPIDLLEYPNAKISLNKAVITDNQKDGLKGIDCTGCLNRSEDSEDSTVDYIKDKEYIGAKIEIDDISDYNYLVFYGKKVAEQGQPNVIVLDENGEIVGKESAKYDDCRDDWQLFLINVTDVKGKTTIYFNGGYNIDTGSPDSEYVFGGIRLY